MKVTPSTAQDVLALLRQHQTCAAALHDVELSRQSIRPFTSATLEAMRRVLIPMEQMEHADDPAERERLTRWRATLARIAAPATTTTLTTPTDPPPNLRETRT